MSLMSTLIYRSTNEPKREGLSWADRWKGTDEGLITCWEVGRNKRASNPDLVAKVERNELPALGWKGGGDNKLKIKKKYGSLNYLAQWQGLRGQNLEIDTSIEIKLTCSKTDMVVTFTGDLSKYSKQP